MADLLPLGGGAVGRAVVGGRVQRRGQPVPHHHSVLHGVPDSVLCLVQVAVPDVTVQKLVSLSNYSDPSSYF